MNAPAKGVDRKKHGASLSLICPKCGARPGGLCMRDTGVHMRTGHQARYIAVDEDRSYFADQSVPAKDRCGALNERWGRTRSRRAGHLDRHHRDGKIRWEIGVRKGIANA